jgi:hypothetical protein
MTPATREACERLVAKWRRGADQCDRQGFHTVATTILECARDLDFVLTREPVSVADELPAEIGRPAWSEVVDG